MFSDKVWNYPKVEHMKGVSLWSDICKHTSLLTFSIVMKLVNYGCKKFWALGPVDQFWKSHLWSEQKLVTIVTFDLVGALW